MTDNEIIKAMQCVIGNDVKCSECTYQKVLPFPSCRRKCAKNALDLINRQKAEIERLNEKITAKDENNYYFMGQLRLAREKLLTAKSEARKEFAERLKCGVPQETGVIRCADVDNLVKEMTEVQE